MFDNIISKKFIAFLGCVVVLFGIDCSSTFGCSTIFLQNNNQMVCGRNFDYYYNNYLIFVNKRNTIKESLQYSKETVEFPATWISKYGSVTFNIAGSDVTPDGMNEAGLVLTSHLLNESVFPVFPSKSSILIDQWVQYLLDNFATVDEVIEGCSQINIRYNTELNWKVHLFVADKEGKTAVIELLNGQVAAYTGSNLAKNAITNTNYLSSIDYYNSGTIIGPITSSINRYRRACQMLDNYDNSDALNYAYSTLDSVEQTITNRKVVFDIANMRVYLKSINNTQLRYFDLGDFDFSCSEPVLIYQETGSDAGNIRGKFIPYSYAINKSAIQSLWDAAHKSYTIDELEEMSNYPETFEYFIVDAGQNSSICDDVCQLNGNEVTSYSGFWSLVKGSGTFDNSSEYNTVVRNLGYGENIMKWTLTGDLGALFDQITITNNKIIADAGIDQEVGTDNALLLANDPAEGTGEWVVLKGDGLITNTLDFSTNVTGLSQGDNIFLWKITNNECVDQDSLVVNYIITNIEDSWGNNGKIHIYPNPSDDFVNIELNSCGIDILNISILNSKGQVVYRKKGKDIYGDFKEIIDVQDFTPGTYYLIIETGERYEFSKFIKL